MTDYRLTDWRSFDSTRELGAGSLVGCRGTLLSLFELVEGSNLLADVGSWHLGCQL
jgi:hypothetical protein